MKGLRHAIVTMGALFGAAFSLLAGDGQWTSEGLPHTAVYSLGLGESPKTLFASTFYGLLRSTEAGVWNAIPGTSTNALPIALDPSDPRVLYAQGIGADLLKSTDGGDNFQILTGLPLQWFGAIAIDPGNTSTVYLGGPGETGGGTVFKSNDGGTSWSALDTAHLVETIAALVVDPQRHDNLYAGSSVYYSYPWWPGGDPGPSSANHALIGSRDAGASWEVLLGSSHSDVSIYSVSALAVEPQTGAVYAGANDSDWGSIYRRSGSSAAWTRIPIGMGLAVSGVNAILIDPTTPTTIYAGTSAAGVFQSLDGGSSWTPMNDGLYQDQTYGHQGLWIHSLVLDPVEGVLRAGTENGVFAIRPNVPAPPCTPATEHLCLLGGRFRVSVMAQKRSGNYVVARGFALQTADRFGAFSFPALTGDSEFPEVVVKMVDPLHGRGVWIFHAGLTNLPYILSITDTTTGQIETYTNDPQNRLCGGADTEAFFGSDAGEGYWDYGHSAVAAGRAGMESGTLSLLGGRFSVTLSAHSSRHNRTESGIAVPGTDRYGYFTLPGFTGDSSFPEVYVKMVDYTSVNGDFWFFHTGLTSLRYTLTVTDSVTGAVRTYESAGDFCAGADVHAFTN